MVVSASETASAPGKPATSWRRWRCAAVVVAVTATLAATFAGPAHASTRIDYSPTFTVGSGPLCAGTISAAATTHPDNAGSVQVFLSMNMFVVNFLSQAYGCSTMTTVHWVNDATGAAGSSVIRLSQSWPGSDTRCSMTVEYYWCEKEGTITMDTGPGWIRSWITTDMPHIAGGAMINAF